MFQDCGGLRQHPRAHMASMWLESDILYTYLYIRIYIRCKCNAQLQIYTYIAEHLLWEMLSNSYMAARRLCHRTKNFAAALLSEVPASLWSSLAHCFWQSNAAPREIFACSSIRRRHWLVKGARHYWFHHSRRPSTSCCSSTSSKKSRMLL